MQKKDYFNIPNMMGYFRIIMVPVFIVLYLRADSDHEYYFSLGVLCLSLITDFFDGKIARRFNMVTSFGKILDPIADKLTQFAIAFVLVFKHSFMVWFLLIFVLKEFYMGAIGAYLLKKDIVYGAQWYGKACTMVIDCGCVFLLLFRNLLPSISSVIIFVMIFFLLFSLVSYMRFHYVLFKKHSSTSSL